MMVRYLTAIMCLVAVNGGVLALGAEAASRPAAGAVALAQIDEDAWSEMVNGLEMRLVARRTCISYGTPIITIYLEARNGSHEPDPIRFVWKGEQMRYRMLDGNGREVGQPGAGGFSGGGPTPYDVTIPVDATMSLNVSCGGHMFHGDKGALVDVSMEQYWVLERGEKGYRLEATLDIPEVAEGQPGAGNWHGRVVLPAIEIPPKVKPIDPARVEKMLRRLEAKVLGESYDQAMDAFSELSLLEDARVAGVLVKVMGTKDQQRMFHAAGDLGQYPTEEAVKGLEVAGRCKGADIKDWGNEESTRTGAEQVRMVAAESLARNGHPRAKTVLLGLADDPCRSVRVTVAETAAKMDSPEAKAVIRRLANDSDEDVRRLAKAALEAKGR